MHSQIQWSKTPTAIFPHRRCTVEPPGHVRFVRRFTYLFAFIALLFGRDGKVYAQDVEIKQVGPHNTTIVRPVMLEGRCVGFDVLADGRLVAPVRFASQGLIYCPRPLRESKGGLEERLVFRGLRAVDGCGLTLKNSVVSISMNQGSYPVIHFDLTLERFDPRDWQSTLGNQPFHFLTITLPEATVWQQGGWLNAAPLADLFPLLLDTHQGSPELSSSAYNREWSLTPPLSAHPLPVIGLWAPAQGLYAAWDFQTERLTENREREIATGFCNRPILPFNPLSKHQTPEETAPATDALVGGVKDPKHAAIGSDEGLRREIDRLGKQKFIALVYPHGGTGYQQCVYPHSGAHLTSQVTLIYSLDLGPTADPNRLLWQTWWESATLRGLLPRVPATVDLSWIGDAGHMQTLPGAPGGSLLAGVEGSFQVPGSQLVNGWGWHNESAVAAPARRHDLNRLKELEAEAAYLARMAKRFNANKTPCAYWQKPLVGRWTDEWGGAPVTTLHNANGWAAGRLLLDLALYDGKKQYLPLVEGVLNWTKQVVWTRNEFADVPSSPFAIGGTLATAFLLDYYFAFKEDQENPERRTRALEALELAHSFTYRYMVMWTADSRRDDSLDSSFLWEPNSGRDWSGAACANEVIWNLDVLAQTAVHTGDPALLWALQGSLAHWHQLYQDRYHKALAAYRPEEFTEGYGLAPGNPYGYPGGRASYGFGGPLSMLEPVGDTKVRVLAGEKAALAFTREGLAVTLHDYRCTSPGDFACTLRTVSGQIDPIGSEDSFDVTVTFPGVDLTDKPVFLRRGGVTQIPLEPGVRVTRDANSLWSLIVKEVRPGDTIVVGSPDLAIAERLPCGPPLTLAGQPISAAQVAPFHSFRLPFDATLDTHWRTGDFAGIIGGLHWIRNVPFVLPEPLLRGMNHPWAMRTSRQEGRTGSAQIYLLYAPGAATPPTLRMDEGSKSLTPIAPPALAWRAWPPALSGRLRMIGYALPVGQRVTGVEPAGNTVVALTELPAASASAWEAPILEALKQGAQEEQTLEEREGVTAALRGILTHLPTGTVRLPPTDGGGPAKDLLERAGLEERVQALTPGQMIDPKQFNAALNPLAFYLDGEDYLNTIQRSGDGAEALIRYVREGGTLVLLASLPYPMYYGRGERTPSDALLPRLGLPLLNAIEAVPNDSLTVERIPGEGILPGAPLVFGFPQGDPRLRTVDRAHLPAGSDYRPIYHIRGRSGKDYGDAGALVTLPAGPQGKRGRILYLSNTLLRDPKYGPRLLQAVLSMLASVHRSP